MPTPQAAVQVPSLQLVPKPPRRSHKWRWIIGLLSFIVVALVIGARILISRAEPILRAKIVETLSARFHSRVELGDLHVSVTNGLRVEGTGLKIFGVTDPNPFAPGVQPLIDVREFDFRADVNSLLRQRAHISTVYVNGLAMNIPPKGERKQIDKLQGDEKIKIVVDQLVCADAKLVINTAKPEKPPLEFDIKSLVMTDVGPGRPMPFVALLTNPKPVGDIQSAGVFGPLEEENIRETAVRGTYSFTNADLGPLKGIAGILSSEGKYSGVLGRIEVDGETDTPDFSLEVSGHHVPLHTVFHAWVDGTDGDTYLQPVKASFLRSSFTAKGKVVRMKSPAGHDIELQVVMDRAFVEDLLKLGVKTDPALMSGPVAMKASLSIRPGEGDIASRLKLAGDFHVRDGRFSSDKIQDRLDALSLRSQGKPKLARQDTDIKVPSDLAGTFRLDQGVLSFSALQFEIPGTQANMSGQYSLDGKTFDIHGKLRLKAKISQMETGWKSILLKPVDPFFAKHGAGTELPFKVTGTNNEPHFGLDFGHKSYEQ